MGRFLQLFPPCQQRIGSWRNRKRCLSPTSAADFCCHEYPSGSPLPSSRLAPFCPPRPASCLHRRLRASDDTRLSTTTPDSRCWHLRPRVATQLTLRHQQQPRSSYPEGASACAGISSRPRCRRIANPMRRLLTPPVAPSAPSGCPGGPKRARIRFPRAPSRPRAPRIRGAFHRQVPLSAAPRLRSERGPSGRHRHPGLATGMGLPTCVHAQPCALDLSAERLFTVALGPHAACRLLQMGDPRARHRAAQTSSLACGGMPPREE